MQWSQTFFLNINGEFWKITIKRPSYAACIVNICTYLFISYAYNIGINVITLTIKNEIIINRSFTIFTCSQLSCSPSCGETPAVEAACYFSVLGAQPLDGSGHLPHRPVSRQGLCCRSSFRLPVQQTSWKCNCYKDSLCRSNIFLIGYSASSSLTPNLTSFFFLYWSVAPFSLDGFQWFVLSFMTAWRQRPLGHLSVSQLFYLGESSLLFMWLRRRL